MVQLKKKISLSKKERIRQTLNNLFNGKCFQEATIFSLTTSENPGNEYMTGPIQNAQSARVEYLWMTK